MILGLMIAVAALGAADRPAERRIYAHYMGCAPAGNGAIHYYKSRTAEGFRGDAKAYQLDGYSLATGGYYDNWPLVPSAAGLSPEENARLEISRARRFGIDGFAFDAWAGGGEAPRGQAQKGRVRLPCERLRRRLGAVGAPHRRADGPLGLHLTGSLCGRRQLTQNRRLLSFQPFEWE